MGDTTLYDPTTHDPDDVVIGAGKGARQLSEITSQLADIANNKVYIRSSGGDDTSAIQKALDGGNFVILSDLSYKITSKLLVDCSKSAILSLGSKIDATGILSGGAIQFFSSAVYPFGYRNTIYKSSGFELVGNQTAGTTGIELGHATNPGNNDIPIEHVLINGFDTNITFLDNSWRLNVSNIASVKAVTNSLHYPSGLTNSGELMTVSKSTFADGGKVVIDGNGEFVFDICSFDNVAIETRGNAHVTLINPHLENPNATTPYRYGALFDNSVLIIRGGELIQDTSATYDLAYFLNNSDSVRGLLIDGLWLPNLPLSQYNPTQDGTYSYVAGTGKTIIKNPMFYADVQNGLNPCPISSIYENLLCNGDAELGNISGWTKNGTGTFEAIAGALRSGSYGFHLLNAGMYQELPCKPGEVVAFTGYAKAPTGTTDGSFALKFYDNGGNQILSSSASITSNVWTQIGQYLARIAPSKTAKVRLEFYSPSEAYIDDLLLTIS